MKFTCYLRTYTVHWSIGGVYSIEASHIHLSFTSLQYHGEFMKYESVVEVLQTHLNVKFVMSFGSKVNFESR